MESSISCRRQEAAQRADNPPPADPFEASRACFEQLVARLADPETDRRTHAELEEQLTVQGRELVRTLFQDSLDLRAVREPRREQVQGADGVARRSVEADHRRRLGTVFGEVTVRRMAYRNRTTTNLYPADAVLNLPAEKHSHGLRRLAAIEAARGSFQDATAAIGRATGVRMGKRQVEALACAAAVDVDDFYAAARPGPSPASDVLVLQADGKGIVMRAEALRPATAKAAATGSRKMATRLSKGEKRNRKRMAEIGSVSDVTPCPRTPADIISIGQEAPPSGTSGPITRGKWLTASVEHDIPHVIESIFDEAERRDPDHRRPWVALVDGNSQQISRIQAEAERRGVQVSVLIDIVHVIEYLWAAAWCFHQEGDPAAERWVGEQTRKILEGKASTVAATLRRKATRAGLTAAGRKKADTAAGYLTSKADDLDYRHALQQGWPIATGIIEGACRHLVKDRMDITGARWGLAGAEAILKLRALISNGDFDDYWSWHLTQEQQRVHHSRYRNHHALAA